MLKIGEFARLVDVPVKTLRYYDEIGLFKSDYIDEQTGYRFYSFEQLPRLNRLLALKDLGLSLSQIDQMLKEDLSADQLRDMLLQKQVELEDLARDIRERVARVGARLSLIEMEDKMPDYEVVIKTVDPVLVASKQEAVPHFAAIGSVMDRLYNGVVAHVVKHKGQFAGPGITVWHENFKPEANIPIKKTIPEGDDVKVHELPGDQMACLVHHGGFEGFPLAYQAGVQWIETNGYEITGPNREVYLQFRPDGDPKDFVTEIQFPIAKV
ncbi:MAG: MerR family transcriptional regulator [Gemmatimonadetes bacterium]|nr:MerR family transcriptional regulator [Gemmatimonadota bacterium]